jgi:hypothetical protein
VGKSAMEKEVPDTVEDTSPLIPRRWPRLRRLLKSIGALIAAVGVAAAGIGYLTSGAEFFSKQVDRSRAQSELRTFVAAADERLMHLDYEAAWAANAKARHLTPTDAHAAAQQVQIAIKWLENAHVSSASGPQSFSAVVDPLKAVLIERLAETRGAARADLEAHIGWANFLRSRDGLPATDIAEEFDAAIADDPANLYGHVMRGFWILWQGQPIDAARADFDVAMHNATDPAFSDRLIMASLTNITTDEFMAGAIEYANTIRRTGRDIDDRTKRLLIWYYSNCLHDNKLLVRIARTLPASEQTLLLDWLRKGANALGDQRVASYFAAYFATRGGQESDAIQRYTNLILTTPDKERTDIEIYRLSQEALRQLQK